MQAEAANAVETEQLRLQVEAIENKLASMFQSIEQRFDQMGQVHDHKGTSAKVEDLTKDVASLQKQLVQSPAGASSAAPRENSKVLKQLTERLNGNLTIRCSLFAFLSFTLLVISIELGIYWFDTFQPVNLVLAIERRAISSLATNPEHISNPNPLKSPILTLLVTSLVSGIEREVTDGFELMMKRLEDPRDITGNSGPTHPWSNEPQPPPSNLRESPPLVFVNNRLELMYLPIYMVLQNWLTFYLRVPNPHPNPGD